MLWREGSLLRNLHKSRILSERPSTGVNSHKWLTTSTKCLYTRSLIRQNMVSSSSEMKLSSNTKYSASAGDRTQEGDWLSVRFVKSCSMNLAWKARVSWSLILAPTVSWSRLTLWQCLSSQWWGLTKCKYFKAQNKTSSSSLSSLRKSTNLIRSKLLT